MKCATKNFILELVVYESNFVFDVPTCQSTLNTDAKATDSWLTLVLTVCTCTLLVTNYERIRETYLIAN